MRSSLQHAFVAPILVALCCLSLSAVEKKAAPTVSAKHAARMKKGLAIFKRDVRRILSTRCLKCHGGEDTTSELSFNTRKELLDGGAEGAVFKIGKAAQSKLVGHVTHKLKPHMPQDSTKLSDRAIASIVEWIDLGAPYDRPLSASNKDPLAWTKTKVAPEARDYWAFKPLKRVAPRLKGGWGRNPIDQFIGSRLNKNGLSPSAPAGDRQLLRRAYLGLLGMPPTEIETQTFLRSKDSEKFDKLVAKLLQRSEFGERWARYWLDVARFAESHGFEHDYDRNFAFHYRDFVIKAFNQDMPYDQFVRWQLAGDEIAPEEPMALMATGFLGAGVFPTQITKNEVERTRYDALDDMAATTGTAMLGLTVGCARCHDHKFDPIPQADYYRFVSTFTTTVRSEVDLDLSSAALKERKQAFDKAHQPLVDAVQRYEKLELAKKLAEWEARGGLKKLGPKWRVLSVEKPQSKGGATFKKFEDGSLLATGKNAPFDTYTLQATTDLKQLTAIRIEALADKSMKRGGPGRASNGNFDLTNLRVFAEPVDSSKGSKQELKFSRASATFEQPSLLVKYVIDNNPKSGWAVDPQFGKNHTAIFELQSAIALSGPVRLTFVLEFNGNTGHNIGRPRLAVSSYSPPFDLKDAAAPDQVVKALSVPAAKRNDKQRRELLSWYKHQDSGWQKLHRVVADHLSTAPKPKMEKVMICGEGVKPMRRHSQGADFFKQTYFLRRGDTDQKQGEAVAGFLQVLTKDMKPAWQIKPPKGISKSYRRRRLAAWITDSKDGAGHLLARVIVNRLWQHHFGVGLVSTPNDFGNQGSPPSHPDLLDWLAGQLIEGGWRLKPIHQLIMTSATYRQASVWQKEAALADPSNRLLWRWKPRRLESEAIRDSMLSVSGMLERRMYGAGTLDESHRRRSIYFKVKRSKLIPMMQLFDMPEPLVSVGGRPTTTIAPQALLLMNNPQVQGYARGLGERLSRLAPKEAARQGYMLTVSRYPSEKETQRAVAFLKRQTASYTKSGKKDAARLAMNDWCQVLFCLNEFVYID